MKILAFDPGVSNFAYCLLHYKVKRNKEQVKVRRIGQLKYTINSVKAKDLKTTSNQFRKNFNWLIKSCKMDPERDLIFLERYMTRPGMRVGLNAELTNIMIGAVLELCHKKGIRVVLEPSSTWKNYYKRVYGNNNISKVFPVKRAKKGEKQHLTIHVREAIAMACYRMELEIGTQGLLKDVINKQFYLDP